jgi:hypothetical protein
MHTGLCLATAAAALALAATADAADVPAAGSGSLAQAMQTVVDVVTTQGPLTFTGSVTDASDNSHWSYTRTVTISSFRPDVPGCTLYFHFSEVTPGNPSTETDGWVPFSKVQQTNVFTLDDEVTQISIKQGHPQWRVTNQPPIYVVSAARADGSVNEFDFYSRDTAMRVAGAVRRAAGLCGGGSGGS